MRKWHLFKPGKAITLHVKHRKSRLIINPGSGLQGSLMGTTRFTPLLEYFSRKSGPARPRVNKLIVACCVVPKTAFSFHRIHLGVDTCFLGLHARTLRYLLSVWADIQCVVDRTLPHHRPPPSLPLFHLLVVI